MSKFKMIDDFIGQENTGMSGKVRFVAEPNACAQCSSMNGQTFDQGNAPKLPIHPNCKCRLVQE
jgi:hypothetical protein